MLKVDTTVASKMGSLDCLLCTHSQLKLTLRLLEILLFLTHLALAALGLYIYTAMSGLTWVMGFDLRSSHLYGKCLHSHLPHLNFVYICMHACYLYTCLQKPEEGIKSPSCPAWVLRLNSMEEQQAPLNTEPSLLCPAPRSHPHTQPFLGF